MSFSSDNSTVCPHGLVCVFHISSLTWQSKEIANLCLQFFNRRKGKLHYIRPVGRSVGVTINFPSPNCVTHTDSYFILTKSHHIPFSTTLYWPSTTKYQPVPPNTFFNRLEQKKRSEFNTRYELFTGSSSQWSPLISNLLLPQRWQPCWLSWPTWSRGEEE